MNSLCPLLTVLFVGLKLTGHIAWPWLWVLAPVWLPIFLVFAVLLAGFLATLLVEVLHNR